MYKLPPVTSCIKGNISNLHHSPMKYFLSPFYRRRMWHSQRNAQDLSSSVLHDLPVYGLNKQPFSKCHPSSRATLLPSTHQSRSGLEGRACRKEALHFLKHLHLGLGLHYDHYCPYFFFFLVVYQTLCFSYIHSALDFYLVLMTDTIFLEILMPWSIIWKLRGDKKATEHSTNWNTKCWFLVSFRGLQSSYFGISR